MSFVKKNFARGLLASGLTSGATQLTMEAGHSLPTDAGNFRLVIWNWDTYPDPSDDPNVEIVTASYSGTPNVYDITRAREDTGGVIHAAASRVALHYTAGVSEGDENVDMKYFGDPDTNGTVRMGLVAPNDFRLQIRVAGSWELLQKWYNS